MRRKRRTRRSYRRIKWFAVIVVLLALAGTAFAYFGSGLKARETADDAASPLGKSVHVMILGVDSRKEDTGRSDTLIVASVDPETKKAALLSVPRDTRVSIDGHGEDKINHAFAFGGEKLSQSTVERFLGVPMDHYVSVDVKAFERIVDAIGGIDLDVEKRMHYEDPWDDNGGLVIDLYPGEQHLDGEKAIQYVRYRDGEGDIGRIGRQQKFMKAVLDKVISPEILPRLPKIVKEVASAVKTDMTPGEMLDFAKILKSVHDQGLTVDMVPGRPAYYQDISYWIPDIVGTRQLLAEEIGAEFTPELRAEAETAEKEYEQKLPKSLRVAAKETKKAGEEDGGSKAMKPSEIHVMVINSSGINGAGAEIADILRKKGFIITNVETGLTDQRQQTTITTSSQNTDIFYGMPFPCIIQDGGDAGQAVVNIGRDYPKKGK